MLPLMSSQSKSSLVLLTIRGDSVASGDDFGASVFERLLSHGTSVVSQVRVAPATVVGMFLCGSGDEVGDATSFGSRGDVLQLMPDGCGSSGHVLPSHPDGGNSGATGG